MRLVRAYSFALLAIEDSKELRELSDLRTASGYIWVHRLFQRRAEIRHHDDCRTNNVSGGIEEKEHSHVSGISRIASYVPSGTF